MQAEDSKQKTSSRRHQALEPHPPDSHFRSSTITFCILLFPITMESSEPSQSPNLVPESKEAPGLPKFTPDPDVFPDGGFQAWLCIAGGWCTVFSSFGWVNCTVTPFPFFVGVYTDSNRKALASSRITIKPTSSLHTVQVTWHGYQRQRGLCYSSSYVRTTQLACSTITMLILPQGLFSGKLSDSYGPRWPLLLGSFMHVFGLMMLSISTEYYQIFLAQCVCSGIGTSFLFYPSE